MAEIIEGILDPLFISEWIDTFTAVISLIPAPMGVLITIAVITAVIRAVL